MTGTELLKLMLRKGCVKVRQKGSHAIVRCGKCQTTVPIHKGKDLPTGTLHKIKTHIDPCLGEGWMNE